jgi:inner membrane protein
LSSIFTHAIAGAALAVIAEANPSAATIAVAAACAVVPDADGIGYMFGIPYGALFGHRGFLHSLTFAALLAAAVTLFFFRQSNPIFHFFICFAATASHGILDAMTDGGLGVAFFSPFDTTRYFFQFRPLLVPPLGIRPFFTSYGLSVLLSEARWVWLPLAVAVLAAQGGRLLNRRH